jgi:hypothetical protein
MKFKKHKILKNVQVVSVRRATISQPLVGLQRKQSNSTSSQFRIITVTNPTTTKMHLVMISGVRLSHGTAVTDWHFLLVGHESGHAVWHLASRGLMVTTKRCTRVCDN